MDVSGSPHRGVLTADDMARWQPTVEAPLTYDYGRYTVCKAGAWSQGPVMLQQLALLKGFDLDGLDPTGPDFIHLQVECAKLAFADRETFYGDPKFVEVPIADAAVGCLQRRAPQARHRQGLARAPARHGRGLWRRGQAAPRRGATRGRRRARCRRADGRDASARCAATPCISTSSTRPATWCPRRRPAAGCNPRRSFPSSASASARRAQMFWLEEDHPSSLAPGKRPRTTLTPDHGAARRRALSRLGLARRRPAGPVDHAVLPAPRPLRPQSAGGDRRAGLAHRAFPVSFWPRTARPGVLVVEDRVPKATIENLRERGHIVEVGPDWSEGRLTAASRVGPRRRAAANPRGMQGYAAGR